MAAVHLVLEEGSHLRGQKLGERELAGEEAAWEGELVAWEGESAAVAAVKADPVADAAPPPPSRGKVFPSSSYTPSERSAAGQFRG